MLIDSHCHLIHKKYSKTPTQLMEEANAAGIEKVISIGTSLKGCVRELEKLKDLDSVYNTVGIYPHEDLNIPLDELESGMQKLIDAYPKVVGIGECGIDITEWKGGRKLEDQIELFEMQINLALKNSLPIVIHNRNGDSQTLKLLEKYTKKSLTGVFHCFTSTWDTAEKAINLGFYISFSGIITYPSGKDIWETVKNIPEDKILVETDAPYLSPQDVRKEVNEPKYVRITAKTLAEVRNTSFEEISQITYQNSCRLFTRMA